MVVAHRLPIPYMSALKGKTWNAGREQYVALRSALIFQSHGRRREYPSVSALSEPRNEPRGLQASKVYNCTGTSITLVANTYLLFNFVIV